MAWMLCGGAARAATLPSRATASAVADRQELEEWLKRWNATVENMMVAQSALQSRITALSEELDSVRADYETLKRNSVTRTDLKRVDEDLKKLATAIEDLDRKRQEDRTLVIKEMEKLARLIAAAPPAMAPSPVPATPTGPFFEHVVESGETISAIVTAYNNELARQGYSKRISIQMVLDANPKMDPKKIQIGDKLRIPDPGK